MDLPSFPPAEFAAAVRREFGEPSASADRSSRILDSVVAELRRIAQTSEELPELRLGESRALLTFVLLSHGIAPDQFPFGTSALLYEEIAARMPVATRVEVVQAVAQGVRNDGKELFALFLMMHMDQAPIVVSTAALECALLWPLENGDPMTGVDLVRMIAADETHKKMAGWRKGAVLAGAVLHGDHRTPAVLHGAWRDLDDDGKSMVTTGVRPGMLLTGTIEFYLRWLEDPDEPELGMPAAVLAGLPRLASPNGEVWKVERRLPADYTITAEQARLDPPVRVLNRWSIPEYGKTILPRLRAVAEREGHPEPMRIVMRAWGG